MFDTGCHFTLILFSVQRTDRSNAKSATFISRKTDNSRCRRAADILPRRHCQVLSGSGFYPYTWWAQHAPSEKWGGSFDKAADQNSPPLFSLGKLHL